MGYHICYILIEKRNKVKVAARRNRRVQIKGSKENSQVG